jgi:hypothetical protein
MLASRSFVVLSALALFGAGCSGQATGKLGESCTRRADCSSGLFCVNQTCVDGAPEVAGLGARGETCSASSDCESGLVCVPTDPGPGAGGVGRCDYANYNLSPTGKTCWAECTTPADCCEIPVESQTVNARSCADLKAYLGSTASACDGTSPAGSTKECFLFKTFCDCATLNPWQCNAGMCTYNLGCSADGEVAKGCPVRTRSSRPLAGVCTNSSCTVSAATGCKNDTECVNTTVTDDATDKCTANECACITGGCYRKCNADLDCAHGYSCDVAQKVCVATGQCATDLYCTTTTGDVTAKCVNQTCKIPCAKDLDCSYSGSFQANSTWTSFNGYVCSQGYCAQVGCSSDSECFVAGDKVKLFCQTTPTTATGATVHSAITD